MAEINEMENKSYIIWKIAIASALSWEISKIAGSAHPYLAPATVILCMQSTVNRSIQFSYHRIAGTVIGIAMAEIALPFLQVNGWTIGLLILAGCLISYWLKQEETAIHQSALSFLLVFVLGHQSGDYFIDRFKDTLIGALAAVIIHMLFHPPNFTKQAANSVNGFSHHLLLTFLKVSSWIETGLGESDGIVFQTEMMELCQELEKTKKMISDAADSLRFNPFRHKSEKIVGNYQQKIHALNQGFSYLSSVVDILTAWSASDAITAQQQTIWSEQIKIAGSFIAGQEEQTVFQPATFLVVTISEEMKKQLFHVTLYQETVLFLNGINK